VACHQQAKIAVGHNPPGRTTAGKHHNHYAYICKNDKFELSFGFIVF